MQFFKKLIFYLIYIATSWIPRDKNLWITGKIAGWSYNTEPPQFFDNSKYFYLYLYNKTETKVYWLTNNENEYALLKNYGLPVVMFNSFKGIWLTLRAKFFFHHYGINQINKILQIGSTQINLWHGTPLKKIGFDVAPQRKRPSLFNKLFNRNGNVYISSTSNYLSVSILKKAFDANEDQFINCGYPRTDILKFNKEDTKLFCQKYSKELLPYIEKIENYKKIFLYMPTWRDDDPNYFLKANINFEELNTALEKINGLLLVKLHPLTNITPIHRFSNIIQIGNDIDIYPLLTFTDFLITDYSSIYFDYLLLDKEIIFIPYDIDSYLKNRELYFDYDEVTPGKKFLCFDDFIANIEKIDSFNYGLERKKIKAMFIEDYNFDSCEKIYNHFRNTR